jgi:hypothetical protein
LGSDAKPDNPDHRQGEQPQRFGGGLSQLPEAGRRRPLRAGSVRRYGANDGEFAGQLSIAVQWDGYDQASAAAKAWDTVLNNLGGTEAAHGNCD